MTLLRISGADLSGNDGEENRTYTISGGTLIEASLKAWVSGVFLNDADFSVSGNTITFINFVYNNQPVALEYDLEGTTVTESAFGYTTVQQVYNMAGIDSTVISETQVEQFIQAAEQEVDNCTFTTYWAEQTSGVTESATSNTLTVSGSPYSTNQYINKYLAIYSGRTITQTRLITGNDANTFTLEMDWATTPSALDTFKVLHTATDPYVSELEDGNGSQQKYLESYPLVLLEALSIADTLVSPSNVSQYKDVGKLRLGPSSEYSYFARNQPQQVDITYWWGVYPIPSLVIQYVNLAAAEMVLATQMGGTYNVPSTYSLPEGSVTVGQAYINIDKTAQRMNSMKKEIAKKLAKYPAIFDEF